MSPYISNLLRSQGLTEHWAGLIGDAATIVLLLALAYLSYLATKRYMVRLIELVFQRSRNTWDE